MDQALLGSGAAALARDGAAGEAGPRGDGGGEGGGYVETARARRLALVGRLALGLDLRQVGGALLDGLRAPRVLAHLPHGEALAGLDDEELGDEVLGHRGDVAPPVLRLEGELALDHLVRVGVGVRGRGSVAGQGECEGV